MATLTSFPATAPIDKTRAFVGGRDYLFDAPTVEWRLVKVTDKGGRIGEIATYTIHQQPGNWLLCDGAGFDIVVYPALRAFLGKATTPNLNAQFIRGVQTSGYIRRANTTQGYMTMAPVGASIANFSGTLLPEGRHRHVIAPSHSIVGWSGNSDAAYFTTDAGDGGAYHVRTSTTGAHIHTKAQDSAVTGWDNEHSRPSSITVVFYIRARVAF